MTYTARTHVNPGEPGESVDQNLGMDNEAHLYARTLYFPVQLLATPYAGSISVADGKAYLVIPSALAGMNLVGVHARVIAAGTTGTMTIQVRNVTQGVDMLTTPVSIDSAETGSDTAATPAVIDTGNDDVAAYDLLAIDVDTIHTTAAKGLVVTLTFS
jgi:hypothetical protein